MRRFPIAARQQALKALTFSEQVLEKGAVHIDMGCGVGDYLLNVCPQHTDIFWIGIDIAKERIEKSAVRLYKKSIHNVCLFCGDGQDFLCSLPAESISEIHINFPDPWLKSKQWKNRLFRPSFVVDLLRTLKKGGRLYFVSDIVSYAESVARLLTAFEGWKSLYQPAVKQNLFQDFPTLFYRKMSAVRPISYVCFQKE